MVLAHRVSGALSALSVGNQGRPVAARGGCPAPTRPGAVAILCIATASIREGSAGGAGSAGGVFWMVQMNPDDLIKVAIWRKLRFQETLYSVRLKHRRTGELKYAVMAHGQHCDRIVLCGGNPGMSYPSEFKGNARGVFVGSWQVQNPVEIK